MPSELKVFLLDALSTGEYRNLFYADTLQETVCFYCPRKDGSNYTPENLQIFKDWDAKKKHKFNYTESRQRLLSALKRSVYLVPISSSKDSYVFRFSTAEEIALNKEKQKKKDPPLDKYASDGESHPSSPESSCGPPSPGEKNNPLLELMFSASSQYNVSSPDDPGNDAEEVLMGSLKAIFSDVQEEVTEYSDPVLGTFNPSFTSDLPGSIDDLWNMYLSDNRTVTVPDLPDSSVGLMDYDDILKSSGTTMEQPSSEQTVEEFTQAVSSCGATQKNLDLDLQTVQAVLQLIQSSSSNLVGVEDAGNKPTSLLVNNCYFVTLRPPPPVS